MSVQSKNTNQAARETATKLMERLASNQARLEMRRFPTALAVTLLLLAGLFAVAQPAVAAPAQPYDVSECYDYSFGGNTYKSCYQSKGVFRVNETSSGQYQVHDTGRGCSQFYVNGELNQETCSKYNNVYHAKDGETQVAHGNGSSSYTYGGVTCTYTSNYTVANGEVRHDHYDYSCV